MGDHHTHGYNLTRDERIHYTPENERLDTQNDGLENCRDRNHFGNDQVEAPIGSENVTPALNMAILGIYWGYPRPTNSGKWRFIGGPS